MRYISVLCAAAAVLLLVVESPSFARSHTGPEWAADDMLVEPGRLNLRVGDVTIADLPNRLTEPRGAFQADRRYVVQLNEPITPERRKMLEELGVVLGEYLPTYAYLADLSDADVNALARTGFVNWVGEYRDEWKIDPKIGQRSFVTEERKTLRANGILWVDISLLEGFAVEPAIEAIDAIDGTEVFGSGMVGRSALVTAAIPINEVHRLAEIHAIQFVEESPEVTLRRNNGIRWIVQTNSFNNTVLYDNGLRGEDQVVGILDSHIDVNHCSFSDTNPIGPNHRKILAYNTGLGSSSHGTHVAGTAVGDPGVNSNARGVAYQGKLVFNTLPVFNFANQVHSRLQEHDGQGARIHSNSWGDDSTTSYNQLARIMDIFSRNHEESLVVIATTNTSTLKNPENAKNPIAVGGSWNTPNQHEHCTGGIGPTSDGRRKPEVHAPGCTVQSSQNNTSCSTTGMQGTSMATPAVSGLAMLVRQYFTDGYYPTGAPNPADEMTPSGALIKAILVNSSVDMTGVSGYPSDLEGWGRVLANDTLSFEGQSRTLIIEDVRNSEGLTTGQEDEIPFFVGGNEKLKVTLAFTDIAGAAGSSNPVVNDLDLEVIAPDGTLYRGNVFSGGVSVPGGAKDPINNVEQVHVNNPADGQWTARVVGAAVNQSTQGYALVVTGNITQTPGNNSCENSQIVGAGSHEITNIGATTTGFSETLCTGDGDVQADVWYVTQVQCAGEFTVSLCDADYPAKVAVYAGQQCPSSPNQAIACDASSCPDTNQPTVTVPVEQFDILRIRVGGVDGAEGEATMVLHCEPVDEPVCPADLTGPADEPDGQVDVFDLLQVISEWGTCDDPNDCPADISGPADEPDGEVDVFDLLKVISEWGTCP